MAHANGTKVTDEGAGEGGWLSSSGEEVSRLTSDAFAWASRELKANPAVGSVIVGCVGLGAALTIGVGELAVGLTLGYAAYLVFADGESPLQALRDAFALEHGHSGDEPKTRKRSSAK